MTEKRIINVQDQAKLSLQKVYSLVRSGIKHRLLRSTLTMSVILLAVAFFMVTLSENVIINAIANGVSEEVKTERSSIYFLNHLYTKPNTIALSRKLAQAHIEKERVAELAAVTGWEEKRVASLAEKCDWEQRYFKFFKHMSVGNRKMLIGNAQGREIFRVLQQGNNYADFQKNMEPLRALKLPTEESKFRALIENVESFTTELKSFQKSWNAKVNELTEKTNQLSNAVFINEWLCDASTEDIQKWQIILKDMHFRFETDVVNKLQSDMRRLRARNEVTEALLSPELKKEWQETFLVKEPLHEMMKRLSDEKALGIVNTYSKRPYTQDDLIGVAEGIAYNKKLSALESVLLKRSAKQSGSVLSGRQTFLLIISFVVCMVGIANAMLMAITERFREIATMKCLGATDSFILIQFMMGAAIQGVAGGVLGMAIGFLLGIIKTTFGFGLYPFLYFPLVAIVLCAVVSLVIGIILAVLASLYPSWAASRMAPMEAMRIE